MDKFYLDVQGNRFLLPQEVGLTGHSWAQFWSEGWEYGSRALRKTFRTYGHYSQPLPLLNPEVVLPYDMRLIRIQTLQLTGPSTGAPFAGYRLSLSNAVPTTANKSSDGTILGYPDTSNIPPRPYHDNSTSYGLEINLQADNKPEDSSPSTISVYNLLNNSHYVKLMQAGTYVGKYQSTAYTVLPYYDKALAGRVITIT